MQETAKLGVPWLGGALGDVRRDGEDGAPKLTRERDSVHARKAPGNPMDIDRQRMGLLPHFQLVIVLHGGNLRHYCRHSSPDYCPSAHFIAAAVTPPPTPHRS